VIETPVLVVGAGPVGLVLAKELAHHRVPCVLIERNLQTTRWPKMDITNCRTMELLRRLGLEQGWRDVSVPGCYSFDVLFSTGLGGRCFARWRLPSVDEWRARIREQNDGTLPAVPYQRGSQVIFEAWLKRLCEQDPLIDVRSGWRFDALVQDSSGVTATVIDTTTEQTHAIRAHYLVGCDGAASAVRRSLGVELEGHTLPRHARMVLFKSRDLQALHAHGQFWHIFFSEPPATLIAQDEVDTWSMNRYYPLDADPLAPTPEEVVCGGLGRNIAIDEVLVSSTWRSNILLARHYRDGRVFLAGDSAHQNVPTGGYGMNTGVGDAVDIGWKLAAVINGWGGAALLDSYEIERRPVAERNIARSERHANVHIQWRRAMQPELLDADAPEGEAHRQALDAFLQAERGENEDHGIELGYRYEGSPVVVHEVGTAPQWTPRHYTPTSWPGARPPSLVLSDGGLLFDRFGAGFTLLDFAGDGRASAVSAAARERGVPFEHVIVHDQHARRLYERDLVLVRPDHHVAWRGDAAPSDPGGMIDTVRGAPARSR
jgi:FAD-dependent monooxygenase